MATSPVEYTIGGVKIHFPCKAYPSQLAMMNSIIRGLNYGQHCLLESPTGSGKSLALLCSALGWQYAQAAKQQEGGHLAEDKSQSEKNCGDSRKSDVTTSCQCVCHSRTNRTTATPVASPDLVDLTVSPCKESPQPPAPEHVTPPQEMQPKRQSIASRLSEKFQASLRSDHEKDDDFQTDRKRIRTAEHTSRKRQRLDKGVIFIDDEPEQENEPSGVRSWTAEPNSQAAGFPSSCCVCGLDLEARMVGGGKRGGGKVKSKKRVHLWFPCSYMTRALLSRER
ncbi:Fanconi anemia group J protein-like protein [Nibea albiflora]|uniref:Fanconi anemia group J protein-like protein n=1 Tax=Nibea albiflora TaxID=240163 RepID=A0ACB7EKC8_NIBAL|nr:Fanconi anemia group J protein-like protein [Nibea albiflora]